MSLSLPGSRLFYLSRDNLDPEKYELIARPSTTWSHITQEYEFDDQHRDHYFIEGLKPRSWQFRNHSFKNYHPNGFNTERRLRSLVYRGVVVMLEHHSSPGAIFYINEEGKLICKSQWIFEMNGADNIIKEYRHSVMCRNYRSGNPRPTSFVLSFSQGLSSMAPEKVYQTINSKTAGRLLAAGGVYNQNPAMYANTAQKLGGDALEGFNQLMNEKTEGALIAASAILLGASKSSATFGSYRPERKLPRDMYGNPTPDTNFPHTQLGTKSGRKGDYTQAREWGYGSNNTLVPKRDIDFTDHGRPGNHTNPHQHDYIINPSGGTLQHGPAKEMVIPK